MVIALFALALAMIVGGAAAMVQGWDIILVERGWSLLIAGSVGAGSGALLLGIAAVVARLGRIRSDLKQLSEHIVRSEPVFPQPPILDPVAAVASGLLEGALGTTGTPASAELPREADDEGTQPTLPPFMRRNEVDSASRERIAGRGETRFGSSVGKGERNHEWPEIAPGRPEAESKIRSSDDLFSEDDRERPEERHTLADRAEDDGPVRERDLSPAAERLPVFGQPTAQEPELRAAHSTTIVGTYNSGDNHYVMFSDGSIEAETPQGKFSFSSLDELKEFIAAGGEDGKTGLATGP
jgi:hypothetical protein